MAYIPTTHAGHGFSVAGVLNAVKTGFSRFGRSLVENSSGATRLRRVEALQAKSDAELKAMGIPRDRIVHTVFLDALYL